MRMRTEAKMSYDYLMRRPTVGRWSPDSLYAAPQVNVVGRRLADRRATVGRSKNLAVDKGYRRGMF